MTLELSNKRNNHTHLNLALDILYGCKWSCGGCHVNTTGQSGILGDDDIKLIKLIGDFVDNGYQPSILIVSATDIFTALNSVKVMDNDNFRTLFKPFLRLGFNTTFLEVDDKVIDVINKMSSDKEVEFKIVIEAKQFTNDKYLKRVREGMLKAQDRIQCAKFVIHPQFNLFDYRMTKLDTVLANYEGLNTRAYEFFGQGIDYVLSFSRSDKLDLNNKLSMMKWIKNMFNEHVTVDNAIDIHFDTGHMKDFQEHIFTYRNGEFFYAPKVYDEYVCYEDEFKIKVVDWKAREFVNHCNDLLIDQYANIHDKECALCEYAPVCTARGIPFFMDYIGTKDCIMPKQAFDVLNIQTPN